MFKITPHGIFVNVIGDKIQAKIPIDQVNPDQLAAIQIGAIIAVKIMYMSTSRIVVEPVL